MSEFETKSGKLIDVTARVYLPEGRLPLKRPPFASFPDYINGLRHLKPRNYPGDFYYEEHMFISRLSRKELAEDNQAYQRMMNNLGYSLEGDLEKAYEDLEQLAKRLLQFWSPSMVNTARDLLGKLQSYLRIPEGEKYELEDLAIMVDHTKNIQSQPPLPGSKIRKAGDLDPFTGVISIIDRGDPTRNESRFPVTFVHELLHFFGKRICSTDGQVYTVGLYRRGQLKLLNEGVTSYLAKEFLNEHFPKIHQGHPISSSKGYSDVVDFLRFQIARRKSSGNSYRAANTVVEYVSEAIATHGYPSRDLIEAAYFKGERAPLRNALKACFGGGGSLVTLLSNMDIINDRESLIQILTAVKELTINSIQDPNQKAALRKRFLLSEDWF